MKNSCFFRACFLLLILSSNVVVQGQDTTNLKVEVQVPPGEYDSLSYYISGNGLSFYPIWEFVRGYFDSTGSILLDIELEETCWLFFTMHPAVYRGEQYKKRSRVMLLVRPGESYRIKYDSASPLLFRIEGDFEKAQNLYNGFNQDRANWLSNSDTLKAEFLIHLEDSINNEVAPFLDLLESGNIDSTYYFTVLHHFEYAHTYAMISHIGQRKRLYEKPKLKKYYPNCSPLNISKFEREALEAAIFEKYPIKKDKAGIFPDLGFYIDNYITYHKSINSLSRKHSVTFKERFEDVVLAYELLDDTLAEAYFAHQFCHGSLVADPDSMATYLFKEFKKKHPESPYMPGVIRHLQMNTIFYAAFYPGLYKSKNPIEELEVTIKNIFSPDIKFLQHSDSISKFDSLLAQFKGNNLFVDFWASWCPPCRYEFRFSDSLHHFLQSNDIEMLYISSDEDDSRWHNAIENYDLKGYHYRVTNPELQKELRTIIDFIPTYMIVDSTGRIVEYEAEKPHTKNKLYDQLIESLNLRQRE